MNLKSTVYGVFIIESVRSTDFAEGEYLSIILNHSITTYYQDCLDKDHLKGLLKDFRKSGFRYLHLSCHANKKGIFINEEFISNQELEGLFGNMKDRRVFLSACEAGNGDLAQRLIGTGKPLSVIGTPDPLDQDKAAVFWPAFYYIMKETDTKKMTRDYLKSSLKKCVDLFDVRINYYSTIKRNDSYYRRLLIRKGKTADSQKLKVSIKPCGKGF